MTMMFPGILDFHRLGQGSSLQIKANYAACVGSRVEMGYERSSNEWREHALRDSIGWTMWFYATDIIRKSYLLLVTQLQHKKTFDHFLLTQTPEPKLTPTASLLEQAWHPVKWLNWRINPGTRFCSPTVKQLEQRGKQLTTQLSSRYAKHPEQLEKHLASLTRVLGNARIHVNMASAVGWIANILLLGLGIPMLNIMLTRARNHHANALETNEVVLPSMPSSNPLSGIQGTTATGVKPGFGGLKNAVTEALSTPQGKHQVMADTMFGAALGMASMALSPAMALGTMIPAYLGLKGYQSWQNKNGLSSSPSQTPVYSSLTPNNNPFALQG